MSTTEPIGPAGTSSDTVVLPAGVTVQPGRQSQQTNGLGAVVQGTLFPVTLANGTTTTVFVADSALTSVPQVQAAFDAKLNALSAIPVG